MGWGMAKTRSEIINDIEDYIRRQGGRYGEWYLGVTGAPKATLFTRHKVKENGDPWIARAAKDEYEARDIAEYFVGTVGCRGHLGKGAETEIYVYAFKILPTTKQ